MYWTPSGTDKMFGFGGVSGFKGLFLQCVGKGRFEPAGHVWYRGSPVKRGFLCTVITFQRLKTKLNKNVENVHVYVAFFLA